MLALKILKLAWGRKAREQLGNKIGQQIKITLKSAEWKLKKQQDLLTLDYYTLQKHSCILLYIVNIGVCWIRQQIK